MFFKTVIGVKKIVLYGKIPNTNIHKKLEHKDDKIRIANQQDIPVISTILADAFKADPVLNWFLKDSTAFVYFFRSLLESIDKSHKNTYITSQATGTAVWLPPGISTSFSLHRHFLLFAFHLLKSGGLTSVKRGLMINRLAEKYHIQEPHYYLYLIGIASNQQGRGIGSELLKTGLNACDEQGIPAYLESSNIKNNPLYERHGFEITQEIQLPNNGPKLWCMLRQPS